MRLALRLGITLAQCKADISSAELSQWMAFDKIDPFTINRTELIIARFMVLIANMTSKRGGYKLNDFLPFLDKARETDFGKLEKMFRAAYGNNQSVKR